MKIIFTFIFIISLNVWAIDNYETSAIGCRGVSQSFELKLSSSVQILNSYLENRSSDAKKEIIQQHIERQLKYLIGISKEYRSIHISKLAISSFRNQINILVTREDRTQLPILDSYWAGNISLGGDPYVKELVSYSGQNVRVSKTDYQTDLIMTTCSPVPLSLLAFYAEFENLTFPLDPYLGFWINQKNERKVIMAKNGKSGLVPICLSQDFLIFGTAPEYAWFYWQPVHRDSSRLCRIEMKERVTQFKIQRSQEFSLKKETKLFSSESSALINVAAVFGQVSHSKNDQIKAYDVLYRDILAIFDTCQSEKDRMSCYSELESYFRKNQFDLDPGQISLIYVLKFYSTMVSNYRLTAKVGNKDYMQFNLAGLSDSNNKSISLSVYAGPTGVFNSYLASSDYWNFVLKSFYQDDLFLYFGHAGVGQNLALKTILDRATASKNQFTKRTKDLNLGVFNCEGYSYFGWDLKSLFENKSSAKHFVNLVASSGTEVNGSFISAYIENFLKSKDVTVEAIVENLSNYVQSDDFLTFQKIPVVP
ncbi:MAG: hypothetical protein H7256_08675 [Bdellovibrio sp.]|nr:hypothetical protein [Bdellovibrio sp.]